MELWDAITGDQFVLLAGPCAIESEEHALFMAKELKKICDENNVTLVYKSSFDKANRSSINSFRGVGLEEGLRILRKVKELGIPIVTDVHEKEQAEKVAEVADILQIPAFLCRQTNLLVSAAKTGKIISVKKGQFISPWETKNIIKKVKEAGNEKIMITERGTSFGYNNLVSDMRSIPIIQSFGVPVCFDCTHSTQMPGAQGTSSGGDREMAKVLARAACAVGINALFAEIHQDPDNAPCDGPNMIKLQDIDAELERYVKISKFAQ